jgi:hypothetical protein
MIEDRLQQLPEITADKHAALLAVDMIDRLLKKETREDASPLNYLRSLVLKKQIEIEKLSEEIRTLKESRTTNLEIHCSLLLSRRECLEIKKLLEEVKSSILEVENDVIATASLPIEDQKIEVIESDPLNKVDNEGNEDSLSHCFDGVCVEKGNVEG